MSRILRLGFNDTGSLPPPKEFNKPTWRLSRGLFEWETQTNKVCSDAYSRRHSS